MSFKTTAVKVSGLRLEWLTGFSTDSQGTTTATGKI